MGNIYFKQMTKKMYHDYFKEYENDPDLYIDKSEFFKYVYNQETVNKYIEKQKSLKRICLAIMLENEIIGEIKLYNITKNEVTLGIAMKNEACKNRGYGTIAERLLIEYVFNNLHKKIIFANTVYTNTRSQHVLEKVGFKKYKEDERSFYYKIEK